MPINMRNFVGPGGMSVLGSFDAQLSRTRATIPADLASALNRWRALEQTPKPAKPDWKTTAALAGAEMAEAIPTPDSTLDVAALLPNRRLDELLAAHNRADLRCLAFDAARAIATKNALTVLSRVSEELIDACQSRYAVCAKALHSAAHVLPAGFTERDAAYARPEFARAWEAARAAHDEMRELRAVVRLLDSPGPTVDVDMRDVQYVRSTVARKHRDRFGKYSYGDVTLLPGALALARMVEKSTDLWVPRWSEAADLASELWPAKGARISVAASG